jgi:Cys-rich protein (TIGR01571 family)
VIFALGVTTGILQPVFNIDQTVVTVLAVVSFVFTGIVVMLARIRYRKRDSIPDECGVPVVGDCLLSFLCPWCSVCQMFGQDKIVACGGDGKPYKGFWNPYSVV